MEEKIYLPRTGIVITERCNLKCKLCAEYSPYYINPPHPNFSKITYAIDFYFQCIDSVGDFSIFGGEPFLHKDLYNIVDYCSKYIDRISRIMILTNGTILPSKKKLMELLYISDLRKKVQINVSNYGECSRHCRDIKEMCDQLGISFREIKYSGKDLFCDGWVDYGDHSKKYFTEEEIKDHSKKCNFRKNIYSNINFDGDSIYFARCGRAFWRKYIGVLPSDTTDVIKFPSSITDDNIDYVKKMIKKLIESDYSDSCAFCNGMCEDSERFEPAEQLTKDELAQFRERLKKIR